MGLWVIGVDEVVGARGGLLLSDRLVIIIVILKVVHEFTLLRRLVQHLLAGIRLELGRLVELKVLSLDQEQLGWLLFLLRRQDVGIKVCLGEVLLELVGLQDLLHAGLALSLDSVDALLAALLELLRFGF